VQWDPGAASTLTGVYADGTPFAFVLDASTNYPDKFAAGTLSLELAVLPSVSPLQIVASATPIPFGIRQGQTITVDSGGVVRDNFMAGRGSTVNVLPGGTVGKNLEAIDATVNVLGGNFGANLTAFDGSIINITGGTTSAQLNAFAGSVVNVSGGALGAAFARRGSVFNIIGGEVGGLSAYSGSEIHISGGVVASPPSYAPPFQQSFGNSLYVGPNVTATISGGTFGDRVMADYNSDFTIEGSDFRIDGQPIAGLQNIGDHTLVNFGWNTLSGVLADGTPFAFAYVDADYIDRATLKVVAVPTVVPRHILAPIDPIPRGIRQGEVLTIGAGGTTGDNFNAGRGTVVSVLAGGTTGNNFEAVAATVNVTGGTVGTNFGAFDGTHINIRDGIIQGRIDAVNGSVINIDGDSQINNIHTDQGSVVNMHGGTIQQGITVGENCVFNYSGGVITTDAPYYVYPRPGIVAYYGSTTNFLGTEFAIDGVPVDQLAVGTPFTLSVLNVTLSGLLADGQVFSFFLESNSYRFGLPFNFLDDARVTLTLVHPGDYNDDEIVDSADYVVWRTNVVSVHPSLAADGNFDGVVDQADLNVWRANFGRSYAAAIGATQVPEPSSAWLLAVGIIVVRTIVRRRTI
jgi:hypothetical protein